MKKIKKNEESVQHVSCTKDTFCYSGKKNGDFYDFLEKKWYRRGKVFSYINRFWKKHVGENYDECRRVLIHNIREKFGYGYDDHFMIHSELYLITRPHSEYDNFVIDLNGNIAENERVSLFHKKYNVALIDNRVVTGYTFDVKKFTKDELLVMEKQIGKDRLHRLFTETITPPEYKKISELVYVYPRPVKLYEKAHPIIEGYVEEFKRGTPEYSRAKYESVDAHKKAVRERKRENLEKEEGLLHEIVENRKSKEWSENLLKIRKHGFDEETSFRNCRYTI